MEDQAPHLGGAKHYNSAKLSQVPRNAAPVTDFLLLVEAFGLEATTV